MASCNVSKKQRNTDLDKMLHRYLLYFTVLTPNADSDYQVGKALKQME